VLDEPLLYERGWGKKLTYVIAFSRRRHVTQYATMVRVKREFQLGDHVWDVTRRYTNDYLGVALRRRLIPERVLHDVSIQASDLGQKERSHITILVGFQLPTLLLVIPLNVGDLYHQFTTLEEPIHRLCRGQPSNSRRPPRLLWPEDGR
jgi:hypothetical protein